MIAALLGAVKMMPRGEGAAAPQWGALTAAVAFEQAGRFDDALAAVGQVVIDLQTERRLREARAQRITQIAVRKPKPLYRDAPILTQRNVEDLNKIQTQYDLADDAHKRRDRHAVTKHMHRAADIRDVVESDVAGRRDSSWATRAILETAALEEARGEKLDVELVNGQVRRVRNKTRDGLLTILPCTELNEAEREKSQILLKAGLEYRGIFEASKEELQAAGAGGPRTGVAGDEDALALRLAKAREKLAKLDAAVIADQHNGRGITAMRLIAGEGRNLRQISTSGSNSALYAKALRRALGVVAKELKITRVRPAVYKV